MSFEAAPKDPLWRLAGREPLGPTWGPVVSRAGHGGQSAAGELADCGLGPGSRARVFVVHAPPSGEPGNAARRLTIGVTISL